MNVANRLQQRLEKVVLACRALADGVAELSTDKQTDSFCRHYLTQHLTLDQLQQKVIKELGKSDWLPLGKLLLIVSEKDVLGTTLAFLAAYITGNQLIIKARESLPILFFLKEHLGLTEEQVTIVDWIGGEQEDQRLLQQVNGVLLAGSERLIRHYRQVTPYPIRLIEFGPKLSAIAIGNELDVDITNIAQLINFEVTLFLQQVCTSPRMIFVESAEIAAELFNELSQQLITMPVLDDSSKLAQSAKYAELKLLEKIPDTIEAVAFEPSTGWGITLTHQLTPNLGFNKGFQLIVGSVEKHLQEANQRWRGLLQTVGIAGYKEFTAYAFCRFCPLGTMHYRPLTAPHDGFFELSALVSFISREV